MKALVPRSSAISSAVPPHLRRRIVWISDDALRNGIHLMGGPGSGKSRLMGRLIAWLLFLRCIPQVILDPTGGTIDNFLSKILRLPEPLQRQCWSRVTYVDMGATDYVTPWPLYYRISPQETLFSVSQRFLEVVKRMDPFLQTASVEGWNALSEIGTYTGMVLAALGLQVTEADYLIRRPQDWKQRFEQALALYPEVEPAVRFFRSFQNAKADQRLRRFRSFTNKLLPFYADPSMQAMFGGSTPGVDWAQVVGSGQTVLLDFRGELNQERRRFKLLWCFNSLVEYLKHRGVAGRDRPVGLMIDEVTQLLGFRTMEHSVMAEDLEELASVIARNYGCWLTIAHQSLAQVDDRIRNVLMQMGSQVIGVTPNPEDALYLARQFFDYNPYRVKKVEPVWMGLSTMTFDGSYTRPTVIDTTTTEYTPEEQLLLLAERFQDLDKFRFLVRTAQSEGQIAGHLRSMSIENLDRNQFPDDALTAEARRQLRRRDGVAVADLLGEIRTRLSSRKMQDKQASPVDRMKDDAHPLQTQPTQTEPKTREEDPQYDDEEIILRDPA